MSQKVRPERIIYTQDDVDAMLKAGEKAVKEGKITHPGGKIDVTKKAPAPKEG